MRLLFAACSVLFGLSLAAAVDPCVFCGSAIHNGERCPFAPDDARSAVEAFNQHGTEIPDALIQKYGNIPPRSDDVFGDTSLTSPPHRLPPAPTARPNRLLHRRPPPPVPFREMRRARTNTPTRIRPSATVDAHVPAHEAERAPLVAAAPPGAGPAGARYRSVAAPPAMPATTPAATTTPPTPSTRPPACPSAARSSP